MEPTNPDVLAFHEAFADIVALFQHFTFPEVLRTRSRRPAATSAARTCSAQLATQFGHARGTHGACATRSASTTRCRGSGSSTCPIPTELDAHLRGARARRDPGGRGVRRLPVDLPKPHARPAAARQRRHRRAAARASSTPTWSTAWRGGGQGGRPRAQHVHPRARLLPAGRPHVRRVPAGADHRRHRPDAGRRARATGSRSSRRSAGAASIRATCARCRRTACAGRAPARTRRWRRARWKRCSESFIENIGLREHVDRLRYEGPPRHLGGDAADPHRPARRHLGVGVESGDPAAADRPGARRVPGARGGAGAPRRPAGVLRQALREARRQQEDGRALNQVFVTILQKETVEHEGQTAHHPLRQHAGARSRRGARHLRDQQGPARPRAPLRTIAFKEGQADRASLAATYFGDSGEPFAALHMIGA